jgi:GTP-dependent phosphoenolpyruvate carboxykinase
LFQTGSLNLDGLTDIKWDKLMSLPKHYWEDDVKENKSFLKSQVGEDLPKVIMDELDAMGKRIKEEL